MAKTKSDLSVQAHQEGDADGLGAFRAAFVGLSIEIGLAVAYGVVLFLTHPHTAMFR